MNVKIYLPPKPKLTLSKAQKKSRGQYLKHLTHFEETGKILRTRTDTIIKYCLLMSNSSNQITGAVMNYLGGDKDCSRCKITFGKEEINGVSGRCWSCEILDGCDFCDREKRNAKFACYYCHYRGCNECLGVNVIKFPTLKATGIGIEKSKYGKVMNICIKCIEKIKLPKKDVVMYANISKMAAESNQI